MGKSASRRSSIWGLYLFINPYEVELERKTHKLYTCLPHQHVGREMEMALVNKTLVMRPSVCLERK